MVKRKIGILTLPLHGNYGGVLQLFALKKFLLELGHEVIHINRWKNIQKPKGAIKLILKGKGVKSILMNYIDPSYNFKKETAIFSNFIDKYIAPSSDLLRSTKQLDSYFKEANFDAVIVGSDQVWRERYTPNVYDYFLDFDFGETKKISYAASYGLNEYEAIKSKPTKIAALLKDFDAISVREDIAVEWFGSLGIDNVEHVIDPTLLLLKEDYDSILDQGEKFEDKKLVTYILDDSVECEDAIAKVASHKNLAPYNLRIKTKSGSEDRQDCLIEHWLKSFRDANFILIDSFHGLVFSALFNVPFIAICNASRGAARFTSICKQLGLEDRLVFGYDDITEDLLNQKIDWKDVNTRLTSLRKNSKSFLEKSLV